jgi:hypothetical protein
VAIQRLGGRETLATDLASPGLVAASSEVTFTGNDPRRSYLAKSMVKVKRNLAPPEWPTPNI